jgi:hypothetical protein
MAYDTEIRFRCRALFEVMNMTLSSIAEQEQVPLSTLSDWKNDDREEFGGIWLAGSKASKVTEASKKLREELQATSVYDEVKNSLNKYQGVTDKGGIKADGMLTLASDNHELQKSIEADLIMLGAVQADYFDALLFKNSMLSSIVLSNQVKNDVTKIKQGDIKASSEIHKIAKESRFGKSPETIILGNNGEYTAEELNDLSVEQLEQLQKKYAMEAEIHEEEKVDE